MASQTLTLSTWAARRRPDEDIFDRTLRGDPVAFSEVYRRYQKRVYGFCLARSLDPCTAADATQEVFMRLLRADPGSIDNPQAWLFTVARNVVIDVARKRTRTPEDAAADDDTLAWDRLKAADTADEVLSRSDARDVFLALRSLRPRYRTALILREVHGESSKDIADALETTPGAVDTLVSRARDAFGAAYASVGDLPAACRANIELIYRNHGTGITPEERSAMDAHAAGCERCRAEAKKADDPRHLAALLPFLIPARLLGRGLIQRAALSVRTVPDAVMQHAPVVLSQPQTWHLGAKVAAGLGCGPDHGPRRDDDHEPRALEACGPVRQRPEHAESAEPRHDGLRWDLDALGRHVAVDGVQGLHGRVVFGHSDVPYDAEQHDQVIVVIDDRSPKDVGQHDPRHQDRDDHRDVGPRHFDGQRPRRHVVTVSAAAPRGRP